MSLPALLIQLMEARSIQGKDLAKRLGHRPSYVSQVRMGKRSIAPKAIPKWAHALRLTELEREEFIMEVMLSHGPPELREYVIRLRANQRN